MYKSKDKYDKGIKDNNDKDDINLVSKVFKTSMYKSKTKFDKDKPKTNTLLPRCSRIPMYKSKDKYDKDKNGINLVAKVFKNSYVQKQ